MPKAKKTVEAPPKPRPPFGNFQVHDPFASRGNRTPNGCGGRLPSFAEFSQLIKENDPQLFADKLMSLAIAANPKNPLTAIAMRLVADRLWPALKSVDVRPANATDIPVDHIKTLAARLSSEDLQQLKQLSAKLAEEPTLQ